MPMRIKVELKNRGSVFGRMKITFCSDAWTIRNATRNGGKGNAQITLKQGTYEFEKVRNPFTSGFWYVLKGTFIGNPAEMFDDYNRPDAGIHRIVIERIPLCPRKAA